jgi:hypothetical protein
MIGVTTFDGFLNGPVWRSASPSLQRALRGLGLSGTAALELVLTFGLLASIALCAALYRAGIAGMGIAARAQPARDLAGAFAHSLAPIARIPARPLLLAARDPRPGDPYLISDPFGTGANLFGTASLKINYGLLGAAAIRYVQVGALLGGHVSGLFLAHDRALVLYRDPAAAAESQRWMLVVMVTFTCLGLWLLSAVNT